jgi:hypothetical protein
MMLMMKSITNMLITTMIIPEVIIITKITPTGMMMNMMTKNIISIQLQ